jgi:uncharacterized protein (TIGR03000 family)
MFRNTFFYSGLFLVSTAALLIRPGAANAQHGGHGGGGGHGGFGGGGFHGGGGHFRGYGGGYHGGGYAGGYHGGYGGIHNHGGYQHGYGYGHYGYGHGWDHYGRYGHYGRGYYPSYYGFWPYYPYWGFGAGYALSSITGLPFDSQGYDAGYYEPESNFTGAVNFIRAPRPAASVAHVTVKVPAQAELWFDGIRMPEDGPVREYESPLLTAGQHYHYDIRAHWTENGHEVTQTQRVEVTAGAQVEADFPIAAAQAPVAHAG